MSEEEKEIAGQPFATNQACRDQYNHAVQRHAQLRDSYRRTVTGISSAALGTSVIFLAHLSDPNDPWLLKILLIVSWVFLLVSVVSMLKGGAIIVNEVGLFADIVYGEKKFIDHEFIESLTTDNEYKSSKQEAYHSYKRGISFLAVGIFCILLYAAWQLWI